MYEYIPPRKGVSARLLVLGLLLLSVAFFVLAFQFSALAPLFQSLGLFLLLPTVQIAARYIILRYLYRITPYESGEVDFEIYSYRGGNKMQLICRVGLEEITAVTPLTDANRRAKKGMPRYNYCPELSPKDAYLLSITNADGSCEVLFSPDQKLLEILRSAIAMKPNEDQTV